MVMIIGILPLKPSSTGIMNFCLKHKEQNPEEDRDRALEINRVPDLASKSNHRPLVDSWKNKRVCSTF